MTVAIRPVVQRSVSNFQVVAPRRRRRGSCRCCAAVNFDGRPGAGFAVKALRPRRRTASRQRITELCEHPSRRATSVTDAPAFSSSIPRRRRRSSSSGLPCGRMPRAYRVKHQMSITYAHINNMASDRATFGMVNGAHYAASKGAVISLTRSLALELGPSGVTVNAINPGTTDTPMARGTLSDAEWQSRARQDPLGRFSTPENIARLVLFLAGPGGEFMTGQVVTVRMRFG